MPSKLRATAHCAALSVLLASSPALLAQETPATAPLQQSPEQQKPQAQPPSAAQEPGKKPKLFYETLVERGGALLGTPPVAVWVPGGHDCAFAAQDGMSIMRRSPQQPEPVTLIDTATLWTKLGAPPAEGKPKKAPPFSLVDANTLRIEHDNAVHHVPIGDGAAKTMLRWPADLDVRDDHEPIAIAPGDRRVAYVKDHDLTVVGQDGKARRVTFDGSQDIVYGGAAHRAEFGISKGLFWSADGRYLAFYREDQRPIDVYPYQDPIATPPRPRHGRYPMAGRADSIVTVGVYDAEDEEVEWLEHDDALDLYWTNLTFTPDGKELYVALVTRGQDRLELARFATSNGKKLSTVLTENDKEWVEPEHGPWFLPEGKFLWWSPRDGHRHLYLCNQDGSEWLQVTKGAFDVQELLAVDATKGRLWFAASGEDPRQRHLFEAKLDGAEVRQLTRERGTHQASLSPDAAFMFVSWSNLETPPQPRFVDVAAGTVEPLPAPTMPLCDYELPHSRMFQVKADDETVLYGHALVPRDLADGQRVPALLYVYGGPHLQQVTDSWLGSASPWLHALANHGYVVCRLDNRGTPNRGIAFEQAVHRRLGTLEVQDQLRAVDWLAQQPFVDATRVGVHGWSYGGYMTLRLLGLAPEKFRCGISGAPVTEWAMYETGYTERYMDTPGENTDGYAQSSCLPLAEKLDARLLLVHGTDDRTVMWSHSLQFADRCIDAGKLIDTMSYPNQTHRLVGKDRVHFQRLLKDHLDRWLAPAK